MAKTYNVKNISSEDLTEPYTKITIKAGETVELDQLHAQRVISVFPYRAKLLPEGHAKADKAEERKPVAIEPEKAVETKDGKRK